MKKIFWMFVVCLVAVNVGCSRGCLSSKGEENTVRIRILSEPDSLDPQMTSTGDGSNDSIFLFEGLFAVHPEKGVAPALAERWTVSEDGRVYTFHLRKDAYWSDGKPVTAEDFIYAWTRAADPKTGSPQATRLQYVKNGAAFFEGKLTDPSQLGFKALDSYTIQLETEGFFPPIFELLSTPTLAPVRKDIIEKFGDRWTRAENIVTNGPFLLKEWKTMEKLVFIKNPNYWDKENVHLEKVEALIIEDQETALKRYLAGEIEFLEALPEAKISTLKERDDFHPSETFGIYYYPLNTKIPSLSDPKVRRALSFAIDSKAIADNILHNGQKPATGWLPPGVEGYPYSTDLVGFNPEEAKRLFAEAGFPEGKGFPTLNIKYNTMEMHKQIAENIQQMWKKNLGIDVKLLNQEWKAHVAALQNHDFEVARLAGIGEYIYPSTFLEGDITGAPGNYSQWSNAQFDELWEKAKKTTTREEQLKIYAEMEKIFLSEMSSIPIYFYADSWMAKTYLKGIHLTPLHKFTFKYVKKE